MSNTVYANSNAVVCKAGDGKVIASFPDVCLSPPPPPAGPVPVPYPNTSMSSDLQEGSKTVKIDGKPIGLKDQSFYKSSPLGDEAATRNFGANVMTHGITGKTFFAAWSMDVTVEGKNVPRHTDMTTSNHSSYPPGNATPGSNLEKMQNLALERIKDEKCPCCGEKACPAAFKKGEEPQTFNEFYKLDEPKSPKKPAGPLSDKALRRGKELADKRAQQAGSCTCSRRTEPEAPCDVFRAPDSDRHKKIEAAWDAERPNYVAKLEAAGTKLKDEGALLSDALNASGKREALVASSKLPRGDPARKEYDKVAANAKGKARINHLTPKEAGGCPTNEKNLQPQQTLCSVCQGVDDMFTKWQG